MSKLTDITHPNFRCTLGACPGIHRSEDGKTFVIIGELLKVGPTEAAVEISADLVLASLGVNDLVEAAERARKELMWAASQLDHQKRPDHAEDCRTTADALRSVLNKIKGGA